MKTTLTYEEYTKIFADTLRQRIASDDQRKTKKGFDATGKVLNANSTPEDIELEPPSVLLNLPQQETFQNARVHKIRNRVFILLLELIEYGRISNDQLDRLQHLTRELIEDNSKLELLNQISQKESSDVNATIIALRKEHYSLMSKLSQLSESMSSQPTNSSNIKEFVITNEKILRISHRLDDLVQNVFIEQDNYFVDRPATLTKKPIDPARIKILI